MAIDSDIQFVSDVDGNPVSVIIPIQLWREIESERETAYLLKSEAMKRRLLDAKERAGGMSFRDARAKLEI
jgi:antitoxin YefM